MVSRSPEALPFSHNLQSKYFSIAFQDEQTKTNFKPIKILFRFVARALLIWRRKNVLVLSFLRHQATSVGLAQWQSDSIFRPLFFAHVSIDKWERLETTLKDFLSSSSENFSSFYYATKSLGRLIDRFVLQNWHQ